MSALPPILRDQRKIDADHLRLLAIFHFIAAGLALFGILFVCGHYALMHAFLANPKMWTSPPQQSAPNPAEFFSLFRWFYLFFGTWFLASSLLNLLSGVFLRARKHRTFSIVVACINCLHVPLGTVLGAFTIAVLLRDSVKDLYEA